MVKTQFLWSNKGIESTNSDFIILLSLQHSVVDLRYYKQVLLDQRVWKGYTIRLPGYGSGCKGIDQVERVTPSGCQGIGIIKCEFITKRLFFLIKSYSERGLMTSKEKVPINHILISDSPVQYSTVQYSSVL